MIRIPDRMFRPIYLGRFMSTILVISSVACRDTVGPSGASPGSQPAAREIIDAAHGGGNRHFFFLPPMVQAPATTGSFDAALSPTVEICAVNQGVCSAPLIASYTMTSGPGSQTVRVNPADQNYIVNWNTGSFALDLHATYRITIKVINAELGHIDVLLVENGSAAKNATTGDVIALVDGRTLPIKFRIDAGLVTSVHVSPSTVVLVPGGTQQFAATAYDAHGAEVSATSVTWSTSNPAVATVSPSGLVTAVSSGSADIHGAIDGVIGVAVVTVSLPSAAFTQVSADWTHTCALRAAGTVACWGSNFNGEGITPDGLGSVAQVSAGAYHNCVLKSDGTVACWGLDAYGQVSVPGGLASVGQISAGWYHSCAVKTDKTAICWGYDYYGEATVPSGLTGVAQLSAGGYYNCALKTDGTVFCWGDNTTGQSTVPAGLATVTQVSAGSLHTCAVKTNGTVVCWGLNDNGQATPPPGLNSVTQVAAGRYHTCALKTDATVVCWGSNDNGQSTVPAGLASVIQLSAGAWHNCALKTDGSLVCWGSNGYGETSVP